MQDLMQLIAHLVPCVAGSTLTTTGWQCASPSESCRQRAQQASCCRRQQCRRRLRRCPQRHSLLLLWRGREDFLLCAGLEEA